MRRPAEILTTLVVFAVVMAGIGWALRATVPSFDAWLVRQVGEGGAWALFLMLMAVCGYFAWRGHRPAKGSAGSLDGR